MLSPPLTRIDGSLPITTFVSSVRTLRHVPGEATAPAPPAGGHRARAQGPADPDDGGHGDDGVADGPR